MSRRPLPPQARPTFHTCCGRCGGSPAAPGAERVFLPAPAGRAPAGGWWGRGPQVPAGDCGAVLPPAGFPGYLGAARASDLAQKLPPKKSVRIKKADREEPRVLIQYCGVNPEVQNRDLDAHFFRFFFFFFFFFEGPLCMCISFDASVLLWKVKNKYDLNLTVLCVFLHRGGRFIA